MASDIEFLETVCERMQQVGLIQSKADFSTRMLGKGPSYLTSMSARDRKVPDEVLTSLAGQLHKEIADGAAELSRHNAEVERCDYDRKHRTELLEWVDKHRAMEPVHYQQERQQTSVTTLSLGPRLIGWLSRRCVAMQ